MMTSDDCGHEGGVHKWVHGGVKYEISDYNCPGSGAKYVHYFDWFYCENCLQSEYKTLEAQSNTYEKIKFNATPK